jgi:hypothetical protein
MLRVAHIRNDIVNSNVVNNLENSTSHELNVSWNDTKIALQTWSKLYHKKKNDIILIISDATDEWKW